MDKIYLTATGVELHIRPLTNKNALQSLMMDAGVFSLLEKPEARKEFSKPEMVGAWQKLFNYCAMNGVADEPTKSDIEELAVIGQSVATQNIARLNWIRYGRINGLDILRDQEDAAHLIQAIISISFLPQETEG